MSGSRKKGAGDYVVAGLVLPLQLLGILLLGIALVGTIYLWRVPSLAKEKDVDLTFALLRTLDSHQLDPLFYLPTDDPDLPGDDLEAISLDVTSLDNSSNKPSPHTRLLRTDLLQARRNLKKLYPVEDEKVWQELEQWGQGLFSVWWAKEREKLPTGTNIEPSEGTKEEHLWFAWFRLRAGNSRAEEDLPLLGKLVRQAYPAQADYDSAMEWAQTYRARIAHLRDFTVEGPLSHQALYKPDPVPATAPPDTEWTLWWLLYHHVGLDEQSKKQVRDRWLGYFLPGKAEAVLAWGRTLESERRAAGDPLPPSSDNVALLCAVERMLGTDEYGVRCRKVGYEAFGKGKGVGALQASLAYGVFPNDDIYYVAASDDRLGLFPVEREARTLFRIAILLLILLGIRSLVFGLLAKVVLKLGDNPLYQRYREKREWFSMGGFLSVLVALALPVLSWLLARIQVPEWLDLTLTPRQMLGETYLSVLLAGGFFLCVTQLLAVLLISLGIDPEKSWLDEAISLPLGIWVLWHFDNSVLSIVSYLALALIPEVILRIGLLEPREDRPRESVSLGWLRPVLVGLIGLACLIAIGFTLSQMNSSSEPSGPVPGPAALDASYVAGDIYSGHSRGASAVIVTPEEAFLSAGADGWLRRWSYGVRQSTHEVQASAKAVRSLVVSPTTKSIFSGGESGTVLEWKDSKSTESTPLEKKTPPISELAVSRDGKLLVAGCSDGGIHVWSLPERSHRTILRGHTGPVHSVSFGGGLLASAGEDGTVRLWDTETLEEKQTLGVHEGGAFCVRFSSDGTLLVSGGKDEVVRVWDLETATESKKFIGHRGAVTSVEILEPKASNVASGSEDKTLRFWNLNSGKEVLLIREFAGAVRGVTSYLEGTFVLTAEDGGSVRLWLLHNLPRQRQ